VILDATLITQDKLNRAVEAARMVFAMFERCGRAH
jgi:hypothetical protein